VGDKGGLAGSLYGSVNFGYRAASDVRPNHPRDLVRRRFGYVPCRPEVENRAGFPVRLWIPKWSDDYLTEQLFNGFAAVRVRFSIRRRASLSQASETLASAMPEKRAAALVMEVAARQAQGNFSIE